jgi:hypothetical protein
VTAPASVDAAAKVAPDSGIVSAVVGAHEIVVVPRLTVKDCDTVDVAAKYLESPG